MFKELEKGKTSDVEKKLSKYWEEEDILNKSIKQGKD